MRGLERALGDDLAALCLGERLLGGLVFGLEHVESLLLSVISEVLLAA